MTIRYRNPVYDGYFADPFVLRDGDRYVAVGTGETVGGRIFRVLVSTDLVHWTCPGGALEPLPETSGTDYWAPEVTHHAGRWWMYYSLGFGDRNHRIRVAVADDPAGPYVDQGADLFPGELFSIDPHPFRDEDGTLYLFHARDDLEGDRVGTMLAVAVLDDPVTVRESPRTILRPSSDAQLYARGREMYGAVHDWHTLEGPFVRRHGGRYWCFYSAGSWQGPGYGVTVAVADHPLGPWAEAEIAPLLRTVPGRVVGPGHNSVVTGPGGGDVIVYHAWDPALTGRRMCVDPIEWSDAGPHVPGPSWEPAELP